MRLSLSQHLSGTPAEVLAVLTDPSFAEQTGLLPHIDQPEVLEHRLEGTSFRQRIRYRFVGDLPPAVTAVLDPKKLVWVAETVFDLERATATFRIDALHFADRFRCAGTHALVADGPGATKRLVSGDLTVRYPLVGATVARAIGSGLGEHLDDEADLINRSLTR